MIGVIPPFRHEPSCYAGEAVPFTLFRMRRFPLFHELIIFIIFRITKLFRRKMGPWMKDQPVVSGEKIHNSRGIQTIESAPYTAYPPLEAPLMLFGSQTCFICRNAVRLSLFIEYTRDAVRMQR